MSTVHKTTRFKKPGITGKNRSSADDSLSQLAFDHAAQANIITTAGNGKIIMANSAACKLLGYSKKELLTKTRSLIFAIKESSFKKMLKQRTDSGKSNALVTAIKKNGKQFPCDITSAIFTDEEGTETAITTVSDMSQKMLQQKKMDQEKEEKVAHNIILARLKQKVIDNKNEKIVAGNIARAKLKQKDIDTKKEKVVADNIILAQTKSDTRLAENNEWIKYIAKTSYDVMWDWDVATGEIYAGDSTQEIFGYTLRNNTLNFTDFCRCLLPEDKETVEKKLQQTLASGGKSWDDAYQFKRRDGSLASVISRASIIRNEEGKAIRLIGAIQDVSRLQELEKKLQEQITIHEEDSEKFLLTAKLSFDVIWDWNILTNEVFLGDGFYELFGYVIKNNKGDMIADWVNYLHPDDKETLVKELQNAIRSTVTHWEHAYRVTRANGSMAKVYVRASIIRDAGGKACRMIGAMQDLSRQKELEEKLEQEMEAKAGYEKKFKLIFNSSSDVLFDADLVAGEVIISDAYEKEFGYKINNNMAHAEDWLSHIHPDDQEAVRLDYQNMLASEATEWKFGYRFLRADHTVANVWSTRIIMRNEAGEAYRIIGAMQDISKQTVLEERLEQEIKLKEKQIAEATEDAKATERSNLGKELHDNINQLLGASKMYLDMARRGGEDSKAYLSRSSEYTLTAIEEIRKLTKGLTTDIIKNLGVCEAIDNIVRDTMEINPVRISLSMESFKENEVNDKFKHTIYRVVQEQLNNILKHAQATKVTISLSQNEETIRLTMADNGVGFDTHKKQTGIGITNIKSRASSYNGIADFISQPGHGCVLNVVFPVSELMVT